MDIWQVKEVTTFPTCWKVYPIREYRETNDITNYYRDKDKALKEAKRRNDKETNK